MKCNKPELLQKYLLEVLGATHSLIEHADRYSFPSGLIVDVFNTNTVRFQKEQNNKELAEQIRNHINSLNGN
ncbi:MAG: hypothetical protein IJ187_07780 [Neisseriaceae bacterium]|nr:hypothetical protein [Neisseriaceae bacterium]